MSCGMIAMTESGIEVENYVSYEIDKYAIQTSEYNFPDIQQRGDVFEADFTEFEGFDYLIGGSPCTYWSIAQRANRETEASGFGWELFQQYVRALKEAKPKFFIYENNKSIPKAIRVSISEALGFEPICINSALLSAQNRNRLYWVGKRNSDGTYSKVNVEQPEDKKIMLKDILRSGYIDREKAYCLKHQAGNVRDYFKKHHTNIVFEYIGDLIRIGDIDTSADAHRVYSCYGKARTLKANAGGQGGKTGLYLTPIPEEFVNDVCDKGLLYKVKDCEIETSHGTFYVNLPNGYYIIRKLTVRECMKLQTVPDWYRFPVSDSRAYKMLGNGWTIEVIKWILKYIKEDMNIE